MKPGKNQTARFRLLASVLHSAPTCSSLPLYRSKDLRFGSKRPLPTLRNPKVWPKAGASGKAPTSRVLFHSHHKIPEDGATTKPAGAFPSPRRSPAVPTSPAFPRAPPGTEREEEDGEGAGDGEAWGGKDTAQAAPGAVPECSPKGTQHRTLVVPAPGTARSTLGHPAMALLTCCRAPPG